MLIVDSQIHIWQNGLPTNPAHRQIVIYSQDDALQEVPRLEDVFGPVPTPQEARHDEK